MVEILAASEVSRAFRRFPAASGAAVGLQARWPRRTPTAGEADGMALSIANN